MAESPKLVATYVRDVRAHARSHPWALLRPRIVRGYFPNKSSGRYQKIFFDILRKNGFKRTRWQLVLPGQTAGLVKRIPKRADGTDQLHARFYANGSIDCEAEHRNFDLKHWSGTRYATLDVLEQILLARVRELGEAQVQKIRRLFVVKPDFVVAVKKSKALL